MKDIELYYGTLWNKNTNDMLLVDFATTRTMSTFKKWMLFWIKELEENVFFSNNRNLENNLNSIISYLKTSSGDYTQHLINTMTNINNTLQSQNFFASETTLYSLLINEGIKTKTPNYLSGFLAYFRIASSQQNLDGEQILGFKHAVEIKTNRKKGDSWNEVKRVVEKYKKDFDDFNLYKKEFEHWKIEQLNQINKRKEELTNSTKEAITSLERSKSKLMLSGPLKMWHDRLAIYDGGKYVASEKQDFKFIHIKNKDAKKNSEASLKKYEISNQLSKNDVANSKMGKIKKAMIMVFIVAFIGLLISCGAMAFPIYVFKKELWDNNQKLIIVTSVLSSFALFIYGYILRICVKNWISSRHISEEIRERISLTEFYLTLIQNGDIKIENSDFALKEIFRRINTGLIKETENGSHILELIKSKINSGS